QSGGAHLPFLQENDELLKVPAGGGVITALPVERYAERPDSEPEVLIIYLGCQTLAFVVQGLCSRYVSLGGRYRSLQEECRGKAGRAIEGAVDSFAFDEIARCDSRTYTAGMNQRQLRVHLRLDQHVGEFLGKLYQLR